MLITRARVHFVLQTNEESRRYPEFKITFTLKQMNPERFGPGFVLPFTHKTWIRNQNFPVSSRIRKLLNPELKVEKLYLDTYESEFLCI